MKFCFKLSFAFLVYVGLSATAFAQENTNDSKFRQLRTELATPNVYRTASGAPGHEYWQQTADYKMQITVDDDNAKITGKETVTYTNNSPDELKYIWLQLDQNKRAKNSDSYKIETGKMSDKMSFDVLKKKANPFDGGFKITSVTDNAGKKLKYTINKTMMRIDLPAKLAPKGKFTFKIDWWYNINDRAQIGGRSGYESFPAENNNLYTIAQFYPRLAMYNEVEGWQHKQFLGRGEFTLCFGDYEVDITVPADHIVGATGVLQNDKDVLTAEQRSRFAKAKTAKEPVMIVNEAEAREAEKGRATTTKTWKFKAENVRDFAFCSSRKFIWDAIGQKFGDRTVMCMSYYPKEGNPLWEKYSTKVVAHTLRVYSKHTFDYPYPVAISVHTNRIGMEYPMICFNGGRPEADGTYSARTKHGMISVIIHEVGHNYFPMIVNSDERQWTWMDEGLNSFLQFLTEQEWDREYPSRRGPPANIVDYMKGDKNGMVPVMSNSEGIYQFGNNAYGKPATALNILRETVMGRELFDFAFKEYSQRWMFKHPTPEDFFRSMEDASGVDLDWFWRGWFFTTDHVDQSLEGVRWFQINTMDPTKEVAFVKADKAAQPISMSEIRNKEAIAETMVEKDPDLKDFYNEYDKNEAEVSDKLKIQKYMSKLTDEEKMLLESGWNFYEVNVKNEGGLVMPIILEFEYEDGTKEEERIPAEIWTKNEKEIFKVFMKEKVVKRIKLDPHLEIADIDMDNNSWPKEVRPTRFELFKQKNFKQENPMQRQQKLDNLQKENE